MRAPTLVLLALLAGCVTVPPDAEPLPEDLEPIEEPEVLDCVDVYPAVGITVDGPEAIGVANNCAEPVECSAIRATGGPADSSVIESGAEWWTAAECGAFLVSCAASDAVESWPVSISCAS